MSDTAPRRLEERIARELVLILGMVVLALIQVTLLLTPLGFALPLLLILVVCRVLIGVQSPFADGGLSVAIRWAFYGGIALDLCSATPLGSHALALLLAASAVALISMPLQAEGIWLPLVAVAVGTLMYELTLALVYLRTVAPLDWSRYGLVVVVPSLILALVPTLPVFYLLRWLDLRNKS